jgi:competence ComEA-like helix-hairpin-helix protein
MARPEGRAPFGPGSEASTPRGGRRAARAAGDAVRRLRALVVLLLLVSSAMVIRALWARRALPHPGALVEVQGAVPAPGLYELPPGATMREAFAAAGADPDSVTDPFSDLPVDHGYRLVLFPDGSARVWLADERLLVGLPVDLNTADTELLQQLPGIGPGRARAIIEARGERPFGSVEDLQRAEGIGPATLDELRPFLSVGGIGEPPPPATGAGQESAP